MNYIKKRLYCSEYWIIGPNPRQNREGTTKFFANTLKIFTRTLWSFRNDPWTSEQPRFPKSSSSKHPDTIATNGAAQVSHCVILSPDVCVRCFPESGHCDTKVRSAPSFSLRLWKRGRKEKIEDCCERPAAVGRSEWILLRVRAAWSWKRRWMMDRRSPCQSCER